MKKEQILLVVCILAAAVIAYANAGLYESVNARSIGDGTDVESSLNVSYDPQYELPAPMGDASRSLLRERRVVVRPPLPTIDAPPPLPPIWVRLLPHPSPDPEFWAPLRERYEITAAEAPPDEGDEAAEQPDDGLDEGETVDDPFQTKPRVDLDKVARLVKKSGDTIPCELVPEGSLKGKPTWTILEGWPDVEFTVVELNARNGSVVGTYRVTGTEIENLYSTVHLEKTCEKEYHERRIRQRVRETDRGALVELARWVMDELEPRYGQEAVQLAIATAEKAIAIEADLASVRYLAQLCRAAFDLDGELRVLMAFMEDGHRNDPAVLELVADALDRGRARAPARRYWQQAAEIGSLSARLGLAENLYASGELAAAREEFRKVQGSGDAAERSQAFEGEARVLIRQGVFNEALAAADRAVQASAANIDAHDAQGAARYYLGRFVEAEQSFRAAVALAPPTHSRSRSNLGMALVAQGKLDAAETEFEACLESDPLNWFDPLAGLGDVNQRRGLLTEANDYFETARVRDPGNPWILLRLATSKLADDVSERALELARELIAAAPGCVDGLRLAGIAIRELDEPDHAEALRHLQRALRKEPQNVDLLRQYAFALLSAGRGEEAMALLGQATATGTGFARRDGRTLLLHAYTLFINRQPMEMVRDVIARALRAEIDDEGAEYGRQLLATITEWNALRIWSDDFRRSRDRLLNGWDENDDALDVRVTSVVSGDGEQHYALFKGFARSAADDRNATAARRKESSRQIREWEADVRLVTTDTRFVMHVFSGTLQEPGEGEKRRGRGGSEIAFVVTRDGKVEIWSTAGTGRTTNLTRIPIQDAEGNDLMFPMDGEFHRVRMERTDHKMGKWQVYLDGAPIGEEQEIGGLADQRNNDLDLGFQVDADAGTQIEVHVDRVQIMRTVD